jgi:hypothetical protein
MPRSALDRKRSARSARTSLVDHSKIERNREERRRRRKFFSFPPRLLVNLPRC